MFKKIVWATDGSESADRALELAKALAGHDSATLLAVHSVEYLVGPRSTGAFPANADEEERVIKINQQVEELAAAGLAASVRIVQGGVAGAAHTLAVVAQEEGADLIVVGTRGLGAAKQLFLGSVSTNIVHHATCDVLVVR